MGLMLSNYVKTLYSGKNLGTGKKPGCWKVQVQALERLCLGEQKVWALKVRGNLDMEEKKTGY